MYSCVLLLIIFIVAVKLVGYEHFSNTHFVSFTFTQHGLITGLALLLGFFLSIHTLRLGHDVHFVMSTCVLLLAWYTYDKPGLGTDPNWAWIVYLYTFMGTFSLVRGAEIAYNKETFAAYRRNNAWWKRQSNWLFFIAAFFASAAVTGSSKSK